jgi:sterol desaturase/sphingolipid hydroxylase (fatty acid hydroxylase superfamily)
MSTKMRAIFFNRGLLDMVTRLFQRGSYFRQLGGSMGHAIIFLTMLFLVVVVCEALSGGRLKRYASRNFLNDTLYALFYRGGIYTIFVYQPFFNSIRPKLAIFDLHLMANWHAYWSVPIFFVVADLFGYWVHRLFHTRFLWPFHSVHHTQEKLTFIAFYRFHFIDYFIANAVGIIPLLLLGAPPRVWPPIFFGQWFLQAIQHSELNWRLGPFYRAIAGPVFHSIHHSPDPKFLNKNFAMTFSFWDFLFGTGVDAKERCSVSGVTGLAMPETIFAQCVMPFRMLYAELLAGHQPASVNSVDHAGLSEHR